MVRITEVDAHGHEIETKEEPKTRQLVIGAASAASTRNNLSVARPAVAKAQAAIDSSWAFNLGAFLSHSTAKASKSVADPVRAVAHAQATLTPSLAENFVQDASALSTKHRQARRSCASPPQPSLARL